MVGELVSREAERADPDLGVEIDAAVRVEDGGARGLASERGVGEGDEIGIGSDRGDRGGDRDHAFRRLDLGSGPGVPRHADAVGAVGIGGGDGGGAAGVVYRHGLGIEGERGEKKWRFFFKGFFLLDLLFDSLGVNR